MRPWLLPLLVACARGADPQAAPPADGIAFADPVRFERHAVAEAEKGATIIVLDGGAQPRVEMRYRTTAGSTSSTLIRMDTETAFASGERGAAAMPAGRIRIDFRMTIAVESIDPQGNLRLVARALDVRLEPLDEPAKVMLQHPAYRAPAEPPSVHATMTPSGELLEVKEDSPHASQYAAVRSFTVPFPSEPIGRGARWRVVQTHEEPAALVEETEWRLDALEGRRARVSARSVWHQASQSIRGPLGSAALRIEGGTTLTDAHVDLDAPPIVEAAAIEMDMRLPFEGTSGHLQIESRGTLKAP